MRSVKLPRKTAQAALLGLIFSLGCSGTPGDPESYSMPTFSGVPEQWEPEVDEAAFDEPLADD